VTATAPVRRASAVIWKAPMNSRARASAGTSARIEPSPGRRAMARATKAWVVPMARAAPHGVVGQRQRELLREYQREHPGAVGHQRQAGVGEPVEALAGRERRVGVGRCEQLADALGHPEEQRVAAGKCLNSAPVVSPTASASTRVVRAAMPRVATTRRAASAISVRRTVGGLAVGHDW
jgi:hypothetical protein